MRSRKRGLSDFDVYSDTRSALEAFNSLVTRHRIIAKIKDLVKQSGVKITAYWIKARVDHPGNERVDELAKAAIERIQVDVVVKLTTTQAKKILLTLPRKDSKLAGTIGLLVIARMRSFLESPSGHFTVIFILIKS